MFPHMLYFCPRWSVAGSLSRDFLLTASCSWFVVCVWRPTVVASPRLHLLFLHPLGRKRCGAGFSFVHEWRTCDPKGFVRAVDSASVDLLQVRFTRERKKTQAVRLSWILQVGLPHRCGTSLWPEQVSSCSPAADQPRIHMFCIIYVGKWSDELRNVPRRHQGPFRSLCLECPLWTRATGESASSESGRERRVPDNHHEGAPKTELCLRGFLGTDRTAIRQWISTILLDANRQSGWLHFGAPFCHREMLEEGVGEHVALISEAEIHQSGLHCLLFFPKTLPWPSFAQAPRHFHLPGSTHLTPHCHEGVHQHLERRGTCMSGQRRHSSTWVICLRCWHWVLQEVAARQPGHIVTRAFGFATHLSSCLQRSLSDYSGVDLRFMFWIAACLTSSLKWVGLWSAVLRWFLAHWASWAEWRWCSKDTLQCHYVFRGPHDQKPPFPLIGVCDTMEFLEVSCRQPPRREVSEGNRPASSNGSVRHPRTKTLPSWLAAARHWRVSGLLFGRVCLCPRKLFFVRSVARSFTSFFTSPPSRHLHTLPTPPPSCRFWCGRLLDRLGHHRSACVEEQIWLSRWCTDIGPSGFRVGRCCSFCASWARRVSHGTSLSVTCEQRCWRYS